MTFPCFLKHVFTPFPGLVWRCACRFRHLLTEVSLLVKFGAHRVTTGGPTNFGPAAPRTPAPTFCGSNHFYWLRGRPDKQPAGCEGEGGILQCKGGTFLQPILHPKKARFLSLVIFWANFSEGTLLCRGPEVDKRPPCAAANFGP